MTTEELDALDALRECATPAPWPHNMWRSHEDCDTLQWCAIGPAHDVVGNEEEDDDSAAYGAAAVDADYLTALVNAAPRLLAEARQAAILRAKLIESETWRTELRQEMDVVKGRLRDVTGQRDALVRAGKLCLSDGVSMNEAWTAMTKALEAAR